MYAKDILEKNRGVKRDKQRKGLFIVGKEVYGNKVFWTEKNKLETDEGAAPAVQRVFAIAAMRAGIRRLHDQQVQSKYESLMHRSSAYPAGKKPHGASK